MKPTTSWKLFLLLGLLVGLALAGCNRASQQPDQAADVNLTLSVEPDPPVVGDCQLTLTLSDAQGQPIPGARLQVKGDMTHAGMRPVLAEAQAGAEGSYQIPFEWTMGGDWIVTVTADLPDGRVAVRQFNLNVAADMADHPGHATEPHR